MEPWIVFEPTRQKWIEARPDKHIVGCVHQQCRDGFDPAQQATISLLNFKMSYDGEILRFVEEMCGLAGIIPVSNDQADFKTKVSFEQQNSVSSISYFKSHDIYDCDYLIIIHQVTEALKRLRSAMGLVQEAGLCCESFTILQQTNGNQEAEVNLRRVTTEKINRLLESAETFLQSTVVDESILEEILQAGLASTLQHSNMEEEVFPSLVHRYALAAQLLCLGFLTYTRAHIGAVRPFFLRYPLQEVRLLGCKHLDDRGTLIVGQRLNLSCMGDMLRQPVFVFKFNQLELHENTSSSSSQQRRLDLKAKIADVLDTWGPGSLLVDQDYRPSAISLRGGLIYRAKESNEKFHWVRASEIKEDRLVAFDPLLKIVIGADLNTCLTKGQERSWEQYKSLLEPLGSCNSRWEFRELQAGIQLGNYALIGLNGTWNKVRGTSLKQHRLSRTREFWIPFLNDLWGLKVGLCTRSARRVTLREMIGDLLPFFISTIFSEKHHHLWKELETTHDILSIFRGDHQLPLQDWFRKPPDEGRELAFNLIDQIFEILKHTSMDKEGKNFLIAWPNRNDVQRCLKIRCIEENAWFPVVADSADCATFAYISPTCLQSTNVKCQGFPDQQSLKITQLETAVICTPASTSTEAWRLEHDLICMLEKSDDMFWVKVDKSHESSPPCLLTRGNSIPVGVKMRMWRKGIAQHRRRLRERQSAQDDGEQVHQGLYQKGVKG